MNPVASVLFVLAGLGFYRSTYASKATRFNSDPVAFWCAVVLLSICIFKGLELATNSPPAIDQLLFASKVRPSDIMVGNVLAPNTVINFFLCGTALLFLDLQPKHGFRPAQALILPAAIITLVALVGYSYQVMAFYRIGRAAPMAFLTAVAFLFLCAAAIACRPNHGIMNFINSPTTGGAMARRLLPMAILIPWVLGVIRWAGECRGWYETQVGVALFTVATMAIFSFLVWWNAKLLHRSDVKRRQAEERLRRAGANLERSNADLQQFAYVASHDLFEPLRMITSYLQLLEQLYKDKLDDRGREFVTFAIDGARRMRALITDLLAYARVDAKGQPFHAVDCNAAASAALSNLKVAIEDAKATVNVGPLPTVNGDDVQLTQLFQNLIGNSIKFKGANPPVIDVIASQQEKTWLFSVKDNGIGISQEYFERIFVIFQRLHTRSEYPGTGIGLAICKRIVERHGGRIWVESAPEQGSTFKFTLPANYS